MDIHQAEQAVSAGVDVIVAQGGEAGGQGGEVATMVLVPQVVDIAGDIPVVAAGGIADGRGPAAALTLGAQGVAIGTRLLASVELGIAEEWKNRIVAAEARDTIKVVHSDRFMPPFSPVAPTDVRARRSHRLRCLQGVFTAGARAAGAVGRHAGAVGVAGEQLRHPGTHPASAVAPQQSYRPPGHAGDLRVAVQGH
jgi:glutamate synthase domain-containing protein 2